jgi:hypothetical protein
MTGLSEAVWRDRELYLPHIKRECVWCGFPLTGKWRWYERYGNGCLPCNGRFMDVFLGNIGRKEAYEMLVTRVRLVKEAKNIKKHNRQSFFKIFRVLEASERAYGSCKNGEH